MSTSLRSQYANRRATVLVALAQRLEEHLKDLFRGFPRIDRISARAKDVDRFVAKAQKVEDGKPQYSDPLNQIQDQIGARIVTFYQSEVENVAAHIMKYFRHIEQRRVVPDSEREFGYEGHHFILFIPIDIIDETINSAEQVDFFELQVKTLFQHAWAESEHDLGYKPSATLSKEQKRRLAFTAAQAWGADQMFDELFKQTEA